MRVSAISYALSVSVPSGNVTVAEIVLLVMLGTSVMPVLSAPATDTASSATETASGSALWRRKNSSERPYPSCMRSNHPSRRGR